MLESIGKEYLIDLCLMIYKEELEKEAFEEYKSELLRACVNNIAGVTGGVMFSKSWSELKDYKPEPRSAEEITSSILDGLHKLGEQK